MKQCVHSLQADHKNQEFNIRMLKYTKVQNYAYVWT